MEDKLVKLVQLVDHGGFTKAAQHMHISQPALSMAIKELEKNLGKQLILRQRGGVSLTKYGQEAYHTGKQIVGLRSSLQKKFSSSTSLDKLRIGLIDSVASQLLSTNYLDTVSKHMKPTLVVNNTSRLLSDLAKDKLDIVFASETSTYDSRTISTETIGNDILACVISRENYELYKTDYKAGYLRNFITYNRESTTYNLINASLASKSVEADPLLSSTSPEVVRSLVLDGSGCGYIPLHEVRHDIEIGELKELDKSLRVNRKIVAYTPKFLEGVPELEEVKKYLRKILS